MKKLLPLLLLSIGLINSSFAGVKDISLKCENGAIYEYWKAKDYQNYFDQYKNKNDPGALYNTSLIIIADSSKSVTVDLSSHFKYSAILEGGYRLKGESSEYYYFEKNLKLNEKKGLASLNINRHTGQVSFRYEITVDEVWREFSSYYGNGYKDWRIGTHKGSFHKDNWDTCEEYQRMF
jgi:hypothetical protein